jgi:ribonuclease P protein component
MPTNTLSKHERLKSYTKIRALFNAGQRMRQFPLSIYYLFEEKVGIENTKEVLHMGVTVGARNFKRAVDRNQLKRRIREAYRLQKSELKAQLQASSFTLDLFFVYADHQITDYSVISASVKKILAKLSEELIVKQTP